MLNILDISLLSKVEIYSISETGDSCHVKENLASRSARLACNLIESIKLSKGRNRKEVEALVSLRAQKGVSTLEESSVCCLEEENFIHGLVEFYW